jgi:hypothetical protein
MNKVHNPIGRLSRPAVTLNVIYESSLVRDCHASLKIVDLHERLGRPPFNLSWICCEGEGWKTPPCVARGYVVYLLTEPYSPYSHRCICNAFSLHYPSHRSNQDPIPDSTRSSEYAGDGPVDHSISKFDQRTMDRSKW